MTTRLRRYDLAAGAVAAIDVRGAVAPYTWAATWEEMGHRQRPAVLTAHDVRPGPADWLPHDAMERAEPPSIEHRETAARGWLRFAAAAAAPGPVAVRLAHLGRIETHLSAVHALTAGPPFEALALAAGAAVPVSLAEGFAYGGPRGAGGAVHYAAASDAAGVATVETAGATVTVRGVAAGAATVTVTATAPHGGQATAAFAVAVA